MGRVAQLADSVIRKRVSGDQIGVPKDSGDGRSEEDEESCWGSR
jgi:hypothetical protein